MSLKELKQKIVEHIPISEVIGRYISLTKRGTSTLAVCPFHDDTNPSMNVTDSRQYYKCFACGAGGNAIDFVMNYKNLDFVEALKEIAEAFGLNFDDYQEDMRKSPREVMAQKILKAAEKDLPTMQVGADLTDAAAKITAAVGIKPKKRRKSA